MSEPQSTADNKKIGERDKKIYSSNQLWIRICIVVIVNLVLLLVWCFTTRTDPDFFSHFSFASTVTSIILSVLAIFMSVTGESKTQAIRDRIEEEADDIVKVSGKLEIQMQELSEKIAIVVHNTDNIKAVISEPNENPQITSGSDAVIAATNSSNPMQR